MFTLKKILNAALLVISYLLSLFSKGSIHWGMPMAVSVEPANVCNLSCVECPIGQNLLTREKANMPFSSYRKIINELSPYLHNVYIYFQGEPFMNSHIFDMINFAFEKKVSSLISTNGHYLSEKNIHKIFQSGLGKLIISIDGTTQNVYKHYRKGGSLDAVIRGSQLLVNERNKLNKKDLKIICQFLVTAKNEHQIEDAKKLAKQIGFDKISFKTAQIYDFENGNDLIPLNEKFSRYKKQKDGTYKIKSNLNNRCWRMWAHPVITASGDVVPCCFDKDAKYIMGNINNESFEQIWDSVKYKLFRKKVFKNRKSIDICRNCTEGLFKTLI